MQKQTHTYIHMVHLQQMAQESVFVANSVSDFFSISKRHFPMPAAFYRKDIVSAHHLLFCKSDNGTARISKYERQIARQVNRNEGSKNLLIS